MGFMPPSYAIPDDDHPGLFRAGPRLAAPYSGDTVDRHRCSATDLAIPGAAAPDLFHAGFDTADLSGFTALQATLEQVRVAGQITDAGATVIRSTLDGATLPLAGGPAVTVLHVADEGLIMRASGPNGRSIVGPRSVGMNGHSAASSVHADQDVHGTPLAQVMDGRAPTLFRHHSPDGHNDDASLMLVNLWIPLQQVTQPLVLGDGTSIDRPRHQLRYGLPTESFLDRDDDTAVNDIWMFLHDPAQRWCFRSDMDTRRAWLFNTLSTPHGAGTLPSEDIAERYYVALEDAESAVEDGDTAALGEALAPLNPVPDPVGASPGRGGRAGHSRRWRVRPSAPCRSSGAPGGRASLRRHPDVTPGDLGLLGENLGGDVLDGFTDLDEPDTHGVEDQSVMEVTPAEVRRYGLGRGDDVFEALVLTSAHSGTASCRTCSRSRGFSPSAGTTSTATPSSSVSSRSSPMSSSSPTPSSRSTSRSTSLEGPSSPRATLPKTRRLCARRRAAASMIAFRR